MEIELKRRDAGFCNIKLFLTYLVIYGHLIEPCIYENKIAYSAYQLIYSFHMPMFAFLSGLFMKDPRACISSAKHAIFCYLIAQPCFMVFYKTGGSIIYPYWHLWYLLSLTFWALLAAVYHKLSSEFTSLQKGALGIFLVILSMITACAVGLKSEVGREWSLSRTIVFFPYFLSGVLMPKHPKVKRPILCGVLFLSGGSLLFFLLRGSIPANFLYQASGYRMIGEYGGILLRASSYLIGMAFCFAIFFLKPNKRLIMSKAGADTLMIYIFHAPIVRYLWEYSGNRFYFEIAPIMAGLILYTLYKIFRFGGKLYRIIPEKKGGKAGDDPIQGNI